MSEPRSSSAPPDRIAPRPGSPFNFELQRRIAGSCPGETFMAPYSIGDPEAIIDSWVMEAELTGHGDTYLGKRRHPRFSWDAIVLLRVHTGKLAGKIIRARAKDVSLGGVGIRLRSNLDPGALVEVMVEGRPCGVSGAVAHCTKTFNGNLVGISFSEPS